MSIEKGYHIALQKCVTKQTIWSIPQQIVN